MDKDKLIKDFTYHPPTDENKWMFPEVREQALKFALWLDSHLVDSREKSLAITKLEEAVFWANAGIARNIDGGYKMEVTVTNTPSDMFGTSDLWEDDGGSVNDGA